MDEVAWIKITYETDECFTRTEYVGLGMKPKIIHIGDVPVYKIEAQFLGKDFKFTKE